jgi:hypothetical protein
MAEALVLSRPQGDDPALLELRHLTSFLMFSVPRIDLLLERCQEFTEWFFHAR